MDSEASSICFISNIYGSYTDYLYYLSKCGKEQRIYKILEDIKVEIKGLNIILINQDIIRLTDNILRIINKMEEHINSEYDFFIFTDKRYRLEKQIKELKDKIKDQQLKESINTIDNRLKEIIEIFE